MNDSKRREFWINYTGDYFCTAFTGKEEAQNDCELMGNVKELHYAISIHPGERVFSRDEMKQKLVNGLGSAFQFGAEKTLGQMADEILDELFPERKDV